MDDAGRQKQNGRKVGEKRLDTKKEGRKNHERTERVFCCAYSVIVNYERDRRTAYTPVYNFRVSFNLLGIKSKHLKSIKADRATESNITLA